MTHSEALQTCIPFGRYRGFPLERVICDNFAYVAKLAKGNNYYGPFKLALDTLKSSPEFQAKMFDDQSTKHMLNKWAIR